MIVIKSMAMNFTSMDPVFRTFDHSVAISITSALKNEMQSQAGIEMFN